MMAGPGGPTGPGSPGGPRGPGGPGIQRFGLGHGFGGGFLLLQKQQQRTKARRESPSMTPIMISAVFADESPLDLATGAGAGVDDVVAPAAHT